MSCQTCLKKWFANDLQIPKFLSACLFIFAPVAELKTQHTVKRRESHEARPYKDLINCLNKLTGRQISERDFSNEWFHYKRKVTSKHIFFFQYAWKYKTFSIIFPCMHFLVTYCEIDMRGLGFVFSCWISFVTTFWSSFNYGKVFSVFSKHGDFTVQSLFQVIDKAARQPKLFPALISGGTYSLFFSTPKTDLCFQSFSQISIQKMKT